MFQSFARYQATPQDLVLPAAASPCAAVMTLVAETQRIPLRLLIHRSRCRLDTARARQLAMYLSHVVLGCTLSEIGDAFGRDRTTVSHACGVIEDLRDDPAFDAEVSALERRLEAHRDSEVDHAC